MDASAESCALPIGSCVVHSGDCVQWLFCSVQLGVLKSKLVWKGSGKQAVKVLPGEPDLAAKQPGIIMHGGVC